MNEELETRKEWVTPEIIDLDVENTTSGDSHPTENTAGGPVS
ncbi:hypothetical protein [Bacteroides ihuae]|nr:hypothetical protein [Bacteroides ihuae]